VPEDSRAGATRGTNRRRYRRTEGRGDPEIGQSAPPKDARFGATRRSIAGKPEMQDEGQPEAYVRGDAHGGVAKRGDSRSDKTSIAEALRFGATRGSIAGTAKGEEGGATRRFVAGEVKGRGLGATLERVTGLPGGCRRRGDPAPHQEAERDDADSMSCGGPWKPLFRPDCAWSSSCGEED